MSEAESRQDDGANDRSSDALDLFFDLVFVYAMSQVTQLMLTDLTWLGVARGALALAAVWWAWTCFAWLATSPGGKLVERTLIFLAMAGILMAATALPTAFGGALCCSAPRTRRCGSFMSCCSCRLVTMTSCGTQSVG